MESAEIVRVLAEITATGDYKRRLCDEPNLADCSLSKAIDNLLGEVAARDAKSRRRLDELADARDDAQTANLMLRRLKEELRARTTQLDSALQKAEMASSAKSQFLANMSHEIRTPMNGILGMAELLRRSSLNDKQRQQVNTIVHSGRALLQIINDILDFSKVESGKFELDPKPFNLVMCLADVIELLRPAANAKSLKIEFECPPDLPELFVGDAGRIRQIVMNLSGNAVKFTEAGSVKLRLTATSASTDNLDLVIDVIDTGIGIPAEKLADVFEKFSQVDMTNVRRYEGTGLGLSISQLLARRMDGEIAVSSVLGTGSTFTFRLKLPVVSRPAETCGDDLEFSSLRVAVIGECSAADQARAEINKLGCAVSLIPSTEFNADIVLIFDVATNDDLAAFIERVSARPSSNKAASVIVWVANGAPGDAKLVASARGAGYICGPFDSALLRGVFEQVVRNSQRGDRSSLVTRHTLSELAAHGRRLVEPAMEIAKRLKVLVVDDSIVNQEVAREFLEECSCDVAVASNGLEALSASANVCYDIVMMDCQMPIMDGFEATAAIRTRANAATPSSVPIVALTANAFASDRERCLAAGMSEFLSKPFLPDDFEAVLRKCSGRQAAPAAHAA